jgi:hypothetical protein
MSNLQRIQTNNNNLRKCVEITNSLPNANEDNNDTFIRLYETGIFGDGEVTSLPNTFCRGWIFLKELDFPNVTTMGTYTCYQCTALEKVNLPKLTSIGNYAFYNCTALTELNFPLLTSIPANGFRQCTAATSVNLPEATGQAGNNAFQKCTSLVSVNIPKITKFVNYTFNGCTELEKLELSENFTSFGGGAALSGCSKLITLILRRPDAIVALGNKNNFDGTPIASGTGFIYVPKSLEDSYKTATNWVTYAAQIRAIEDYPEITGG